MLSVNDIKDKFPPLPENRATVAPVFYEPVAMSGERYTICVAAIMNSGEVKIVATIDRDTLICMFGSNAQTVGYFIQETINSLETWLKTANDFSGYKPATGNIFLGPVKQLHANTINDALKSAIRNTAALASLNFVENNDHIENDDSKTGSYTTRWIKRVKREVLASNQQAKSNFNRTIGKIHTYHFVGNHYVANLAAMNPATANRSITEAKKFLWDLSVARDYSFDLETSELIVFLPENDEIQYSDKQFKQARALLDFFEEEADKKHIRLVVTSSAREAANRLVKYA